MSASADIAKAVRIELEDIGRLHKGTQRDFSA
jgi:hypothetical protein